MDSSHKLDAPNNDELQAIEQLEDRSGLSTLYREPGEQFEGEIMSAEERARVKDKEITQITSSISWSSLKIGLYVPLPLISGLLLAITLYSLTWLDKFIFIGTVFVVGATWLGLSYSAYASIFRIFYKHALRAGPFLFVMLTSVLMVSQAAYSTVLEDFAGQSLLFNIALVSIMVIVYSIIATFIILLAWGSPTVKSGIKALVASIVILISASLVIVAYLL
ncbi:MAG: hypothetical protein WAQ27_00680 [Candidatus Microsaccharimonas sp.]